jgi:NAD dependent epimerase/dehydratase
VSWRTKRVLVTGAAGFIGSHLTERLVEAGATTRAFVHYNALGARGWLDRSPVQRDVEIVAGDICDRDSVAHAMTDIDVVFHLAALIAIPYSYRAPASYVRVNVDGTVNVLQAARDGRVERIVHTSTSEVYGTARYVPIDEAHPLQGQSPYAASKIGADKMAEAFRLSFGVPVVTVRPFNTFGPRQSARAIVPTIMSQGLTGGVVRLGHLTPTRDLNFVSNTVDGFLRAGSAPGAEGQTINLGTGREVSVGDLVRMIGAIMGRPITIETDARRLRPEASEVERLLADTARAKQLLGWEPEVTLEDGLRRTLEWMQANPEGYRPDVYTV